MIGISLSIFSPILFLQDSGIIYTNSENVKDTVFSTEVKNIGSSYNYLLKCYAGISVIWSYIQFFIFGDVINSTDPVDNIVLSVFIPLFPLILTALILPTFIFLDMTRDKRKAYILKWANKY